MLYADYMKSFREDSNNKVIMRDIQGALANLETVYWEDIQREVSNYFFTDTPEYEAMVRLVEASTQFNITLLPVEEA